MTKKMLIDATHHEETRVAIVEDARLEEFDYESTFRKALKGSIFLAKVTRVEPSLQAAFVYFGGNRHGFLPFSEIHPDYFRIPISDREALMAEQEEELKQLEEEEKEDSDIEDGIELPDDEIDAPLADEIVDIADTDLENIEDNVENNDDEAEELDKEDSIDNNIEDEDSLEGVDDNSDSEATDDNNSRKHNARYRGRGRSRGRRTMAHSNPKVESFGGDEIDDEQRFRFKMRRKYKIQEVVKRGQIMLVQASKEERGNKGAAVGTYLSLPGRYCVLMPNSPRAGGISRKISNYKDRAKMRELLKHLEVPKGMSVILRTAGVTRTKAEIKRDLEYLMRLWNNIRDLTLESSAPALVYEEANLVKRAVRDLYTRDIEEIVVAGEDGYKTSKDFMKMMIPSHVKKVKEFKDNKASLFQKYGIEKQISEIGETTVTLKSGGYLVINPTEALVSVDVNSGKATKERHIEETALKTNLEAAEEVARQLRLRDLGGLVVIDFIDMEDRRNNGKVERRMRESLSGDRARIQMGRISAFGLMELSRQRLNPSLAESQFETCPHCEGTGRIRTSDAAAIMLLRSIEEEAARGRAAQLIAHVSNPVALYLLNQKRQHLSEIEERYEINVAIRVDDDLGAAGFRIEVSKPADKVTQGNLDSDEDQSRGNRRRGRRGGRRRNKDKDNHTENKISNESVGDTPVTEQKEKEESDNKDSKEKSKKKSSSRTKKKADSKADDQHTNPEETQEKPQKKPAKSKRETPQVSNDHAPKIEAEKDKPITKKKSSAKKKEKPQEAKDYETVNEAPKTKKKGWWNL